MKIKEQVLTIEQAKHLQELGLDMSDATHTWVSTFEYEFAVEPKTVWQISLSNQSNKCGIVNEIIPTYTLQEVLDKLPYDMTWDTWQWQIDHCGENMEYNDGDGYASHREVDGSLLDKAYKMLCWVLENGYLKEETHV